MNTDGLVREGRHLDLIGAAACVALTLGVYLVGVVPLLDAHAAYEADEKAFVTEQTKALRVEKTLLALQTRLETTERRAAASHLHLRPLATAPLHVAKIAQLAGACGLQMDDMQTGAPTPGEFAIAVPVQLTGTGTYTACTLFLNRLREVLPETRVESFALTATANDQTEAAAFRFDLTWHARLKAPHQEADGPPTSAAPTPADAQRT